MAKVNKGNPNGYKPETSPLDNTRNKGTYEKKLDTINKGKVGEAIRLIDGSGNVISQARTRTSVATEIANKFNRLKSDTNERRKKNTEFLESRQKTGVVGTKSMNKK